MSKSNSHRFGKQAQSILLKSKSCALTQISIFQQMLDKKDNEILEAISGLSGGVLSKGSTCGVVFSGAMSLAMLIDSKVENWKNVDEILLHRLIGKYSKWFEENYKSTICRDIINLDLWTLKGVVKLLLPQKIHKCLTQTKGSIIYLTSIVDDLELQKKEDLIQCSQNMHCARTILENVRKATSIGNTNLEQLSIAFDGGVGLQGGACGAITGAIMALNLYNTDGHSLEKNKKNSKKYLSYLLRNKIENRIAKNPVAYRAKELIEQFLEQTGSLECKQIIGKEFSDWEQFQKHMATSQICDRLIALTSNEVIKYIKKQSNNLV